LKLEKYEATLEDCNKVLATDPKHVKAMMKKGEALLALGRWQQAYEVFEAAATLSDLPKITEVANAYATVLKEEVNNNKEYTEKEFAQKDKRVLVEKKVGNILYSKKYFEAAIKHYTKALKLFGFEPNEELKSPPSSSSSNEDKMESEPKIPKDSNLAILLCNRATAYYTWYDALTSDEFLQRQQCLKKALEDASYAIAADPNYVKAHWRRGQVYLKMRKFSKAISDLRKAYSLQPSPQIKNDLSKAIKGIKNTKGYKVKKLLEHESVVMPKKCEIWELRHNQNIQSLLDNKDVREMMRAIKNDPESVKKYLKDDTKRQWLLTLMNTLDPKFESQLIKEEQQDEDELSLLDDDPK
jgi:tetratricopeptide (TPR) repeat protein